MLRLFLENSSEIWWRYGKSQQKGIEICMKNLAAFFCVQKFFFFFCYFKQKNFSLFEKFSAFVSDWNCFVSFLYSLTETKVENVGNKVVLFLQRVTKVFCVLTFSVVFPRTEINLVYSWQKAYSLRNTFKYTHTHTHFREWMNVVNAAWKSHDNIEFLKWYKLHV